MTESQPARTNRDGHPCPPWCTVNHDQELIPGRFSAAHGAATASLRLAELEYVSARPCQTPSRSPEIQVTWSGHDSIFLAPASAECVAGLLDVMADAAPADVRELAAAIRRAAAEITAPPPENSAKCSDHRPVLDSEVGWYCAACGSDAPPVSQGGQA